MDITDSQLSFWCGQWLRAKPVEVLFRVQHLAQVTGLRLDDGREVVVKVRPGAKRLLGCTYVHRELYAAGLPCPRPLAGPTPLGGYAANAELLLSGGAPLDPDADGAVFAYAGLLADIARLAPTLDGAPTLLPPMPWTDWGSDRARLWPDPDDRPGDLNATVVPWLDEIAVRLRERLARVPDPLVIGHGDFEAQNLRFVNGEPYAVHDWDSALAAPEPVLAGFAAAVWPLGAVPGSSATSATLAQTEAFLDAYQRARAVRWNADQLGAAWAAGLWVLAFNAKKAALSGEIDQLDRADAAQRLRHAGC